MWKYPYDFRLFCFSCANKLCFTVLFYIHAFVNCRLLLTFTNSLDPEQARQDVGPDLDPNCLTL